jgi:hypothetical protein
MPTIRPEDDRVHTPPDDPRWRESYYWTFFDPEAEIGGFTSIGKRAAKGYTGSINCIWGPAIPTLMATEYGSEKSHTDDYSVAGLRYLSRAPFGPWKLSFDGPLNEGGTGIECDQGALGPTAPSPVREASTAPKVSVHYELTFTPEHEPYLYEAREEWRDLFDGHYDEVGRVEGEIEIDGKDFEIKGRGMKDHSWGVRDWFKPTDWRWTEVLALEGPAVTMWQVNFGRDSVRDGAIHDSSGVEAVTSYDERVEYADESAERGGKPLPLAIEFEAGAASHQIAARGEIVRVVPIIFHRDVDGARETSWNDRALVRFEMEHGEIAWANVEFLSLLPDSSNEAPGS